jgi:ABC-type lipoprotein release transport system permease subunit
MNISSSLLVLTIAARSLWRHRARTIIVITMIGLSLASLIFLNGLYDGMIDQMIRSTTQSDSLDISVYGNNYRSSGLLSDSIRDTESVTRVIKADPGVKSFVYRTRNDGMISSARYSQGVTIIGILPEREQGLTNIASSITSGSYSFDPAKHEAIIGSQLAEDLKVRIGSKIIIMGQAMDKNIASAAYRVAGIVKTVNPAIDKYVVFVPYAAARELFRTGSRLQQFAAKVKDPKELDATAERLQKALGKKAEVFTWEKLYPSLIFMQKSIRQYNVISYLIVFIIVGIGIFNIVLISIMERVKEYGIMLAVGTRFSQLARMIVYESLIVGGFGLGVGTILGYGLLVYFNICGLDLRAFGKGFEMFGMASIMYPRISASYFIMSAIAVFSTSIISALWPIRILKKLRPVQAIRYN